MCINIYRVNPELRINLYLGYRFIFKCMRAEACERAGDITRVDAT